MGVNAFINFSNGAKGESRQEGFKDWIEIQGWDWEIEAESSWTKGGGASVGKPNPGKLNFESYFNRASPVVMKFICTGQAFDNVELQMCKTTGAATPQQFFKMVMTGVYITKVSQSGTEEGNITQKIELVFKTTKIDYKMQNDVGKLEAPVSYTWDIPAGKAS